MGDRPRLTGAMPPRTSSTFRPLSQWASASKSSSLTHSFTTSEYMTVAMGPRSKRQPPAGRWIRVFGIAIAVMSSVATGCEGKDCPAVLHLDRVDVELPADVADDGSALQICVDGVCSGIGDTVYLTGRTLTMTLDLSTTDQPASSATVRLVDATASIDVTLTAKWKIDKHDGCGRSRYIKLHLDPATTSLQLAS
jgi:hypothetical protein